jgi:hypothetical protein
MIGKVCPRTKKGSSFRNLKAYITDQKKGENPGEKVEFADCLNLASQKTASLEMESTAFANTRSTDPVIHLLLSWREAEKPTCEQAAEAVKITLAELNLSECQAVYGLHRNTNNVHLHLCVNRIDPQTLKAIDPAGGWTRRAMERAARKIEHTQGWQTEANTWSEINERGEVIRKPMKEKVKIPQKVQDAENLTGEKSALRKAQEALGNEIKKAQNWEELHGLMRRLGMQYQKKGSGGVIVVGDVPVKASEVSRILSLSQLEKRLGKFQEDMKNNGLNAVPLAEPQPLDTLNDTAVWRRYAQARKDFYKEKKNIRETLSRNQAAERGELKSRQQAERKAKRKDLAGASRQEIGRERSIQATRHAYERATLKERQKEARARLQNKYGAFMSYEEWLRGTGLDADAEKWRLRKNKKILLRVQNRKSSGRHNRSQGCPVMSCSRQDKGLNLSTKTGESPLSTPGV